MRADVIPSLGELLSDELLHKTVIVIDVLRATSCMVTALEQGCAGILPVETVNQAKCLHGQGSLLAGERFCRKILGFDLGNSPYDYLNEDVAGKQVIMTTTNGTRAIQKSHKAETIFAGSILNARSCAAAAAAKKRDIVIVCAGTQDSFSLEDGLGAGFILAELERLGLPLELNDFGMAMYALYIQRRNDLPQAILACKNGRKLVKMGLQRDVYFCTQPNEYQTVPVLKGNKLVDNCNVPLIDCEFPATSSRKSALR